MHFFLYFLFLIEMKTSIKKCFFCFLCQTEIVFLLFQSERTKSIIKKKKSDGNTTSEGTSDSCDKAGSQTEIPATCRKFGTIRTHHHSCINRVARETKTAGTLAVVVGGFVACWLPFFILYLVTPFLPMEPPDILMPALTWLGKLTFFKTSSTQEFINKNKHNLFKFVFRID